MKLSTDGRNVTTSPIKARPPYSWTEMIVFPLVLPLILFASVWCAAIVSGALWRAISYSWTTTGLAYVGLAAWAFFSYWRTNNRSARK